MGARARWAVPAGATAAVGVIVAATAVANAAAPSLPKQSVAQLIADLQQAAGKPQGPVTATIQETANLGLPALPQIGDITNQSGQLGALSALAGTTTINFWYLNPTHVRIAKQVQMGESDLRLNGNQLWLWDSKSQTATHVLLPAEFAGNAKSSSSQASASSGSAQGFSPSPAAVARQVLQALGPSTSVQLGPNTTVAGRSAYQIALAPKQSGSLVNQILIAIDATRHIPLQVEVLANGSSSPAFQVGYTALTFGPPAESNFAFTPPAGAKVKTIKVPDKVPGGPLAGGLHGLGLGPLGLAGLAQGGGGNPFFGAINSGVLRQPIHSWAAPALSKAAANQLRERLIANLPKILTNAQRAAAIKKIDALIAAREQGKGGWMAYSPLAPSVAPPMLNAVALKQLNAQFAAHLPKSMTKAQRAAAIRQFDRGFAISAKIAKARLQASPPEVRGISKARPLGIIRMSGVPAFPPGFGTPKVLGKYWTSVIATPASPGVAAAVRQALAATTRGGHTDAFGFGSSSQQAPGSAPAVAFASPVPMGPYTAILQAILKASTPVKGSWGSGRLLQTTLLSVLITSRGQILAGAVTPSVLYSDAATLSQ